MTKKKMYSRIYFRSTKNYYTPTSYGFILGLNDATPIILDKNYREKLARVKLQSETKESTKICNFELLFCALTSLKKIREYSCELITLFFVTKIHQ